MACGSLRRWLVRLACVAFSEMDRDGITGFFADCGLGGFGDGEFVGAVAEGHECAAEWFAVDGSADLDESASTEEVRGPVGDDASPRARVGATNQRGAKGVVEWSDCVGDDSAGGDGVGNDRDVGGHDSPSVAFWIGSWMT